MSVQSEIDRIKGNIAGAYAALEEKEADLPDVRNSANLPQTITDMPKPYTKFAGPYGRILTTTTIGSVNAYIQKVEAVDGKLILTLAIGGSATRAGSFNTTGTLEVRY